MPPPGHVISCPSQDIEKKYHGAISIQGLPLWRRRCAKEKLSRMAIPHVMPMNP
ncbi:MAG: hypothetical protein J7L11_06710 [Thermoprotei archaeon]|nr:hypothetical protein [Thermoprotei archaeon]